MVPILLATALSSPSVVAKGGVPTTAVITGPGLAQPIRLGGYPAPYGGWPFAHLLGAVSSRGSSLSSSGTVRYSDPVPSEEGLGPAYLVSYIEGHPGRERVGWVVHQVLYPFALAGPVVYTPPGQAEAFFHTLGQRETSGWKRAPGELLKLLAREGFPKAPSDSDPRRTLRHMVSGVAGAFDFIESLAEALMASLAPLALTPEPAPSPTPTLSWQQCAVGPWATHCPEAWWARDVSEMAGFTVVGDTGSAIEKG